MKSKTTLLLALLLSGLLILAACAPPATPEASMPEEAQEESGQPSDAEEATTVPEEKETVVEPKEPEQESYPAPEKESADSSAGTAAYPGIELVGSASDIDLSEAVPSTEYAVTDKDQDLVKSQAFIERSELTIKDGKPAQVELVLAGSLPTPCNALRIVTNEPTDNGHVVVEVYSLVDPGMNCIQVLEPFSAVVPLGEFEAGKYNVTINGEINGEFKIP